MFWKKKNMLTIVLSLLIFTILIKIIRNKFYVEYNKNQKYKNNFNIKLFSILIIFIVVLSFLIYKTELNERIQNFGINSINNSTEIFSIVISIIWGLGLSVLFKNSCDAVNCLVKEPNTKDIEELYFKYDNSDDCYKYFPVVVNC